MKDPFLLLGIDEEADDETVRATYLQQVRAHPPDRDPERFQEIYKAYEAVKTFRERMAVRLLGAPDPDLRPLMPYLLPQGQPVQPSEEALLALLSESIRNLRLPTSTQPEQP